MADVAEGPVECLQRIHLDLSNDIPTTIRRMKGPYFGETLKAANNFLGRLPGHLDHGDGTDTVDSRTCLEGDGEALNDAIRCQVIDTRPHGCTRDAERRCHGRHWHPAIGT